ncbi:MAG: hypothetical protein J6J20_03840 [Muribaculaceae bacterium]|nr:hypothetical protein [Muribaculaceae bacterium]
MVPDVPGTSVIMVGRYMAHSTRAFASFYRHHRAAASPYVTYDAARLPAMPLLRVITRDGWRLLGHLRPPLRLPRGRRRRPRASCSPFTLHPSLFTAPIKMGA